MAERERRLLLPGVLEQVRAACDFVVEVAAEAGLGDDALFHCQLSVEEIFTNIVEHGYQYNGDAKVIELRCKITDSTFFISIIDEAPQFNPLDLESPDKNLSLWEREEEGGWGVYFVRQYMDDITYSFVEKRNQLTLVKHLPKN